MFPSCSYQSCTHDKERVEIFSNERRDHKHVVGELEVAALGAFSQLVKKCLLKRSETQMKKRKMFYVRLYSTRADTYKQVITLQT